MDFIKLAEVLKKEPAYRLKQAKKAVFQDLISDWQEAKNLPFSLREKLNKNCPLEIKAEVFESGGKGKTIKALLTLNDSLKIETVLMQHKDDRNTVCVSSQVGCPLNCSFCATGKMGFKRNLESNEIIEQVLFFARLLKEPTRIPPKAGSVAGGSVRIATRSVAGGEKISNVVFMGMGEPFLNYGNVTDAIKILNDKDGFNLGGRHFSISTIGIIEGIKKLAEEDPQINLAVSLHAPNDKLRSELIPANKKYNIAKIMKAVGEYIKKTKRRVMFEYLMINGVNDSEENAYELARLLKNPPLSGKLCFVNLISYNTTGVFKPSFPEKIKKFKETLEKEKISVTQRYKFGKDIKAACGQLVASAL